MLPAAETLRFIGHSASQRLQEMQLSSRLTILKMRNKFEIPSNAPNGHKYLHQGRSTTKAVRATARRMANASRATSPDQKVNSA